jgi:hypothetical protein
MSYLVAFRMGGGNTTHGGMAECYFIFFCYLSKKFTCSMNALRTFATPDANGMLTIQLPDEYRQQQLEVIDLPLSDFGIPKDKYYFENLAKIQQKAQKEAELTKSMSEMAQQATANGLTPEILADILNTPE